MSLQEWTEKILSMFRQESLTFGFATMILDNTVRKLNDEAIAQKNDDEKQRAAQCECAAAGRVSKASFSCLHNGQESDPKRNCTNREVLPDSGH